MGCRAFALRGCLWRRGCSGRRMAQPPARLGVLTSFGAAPRSPPVPSGPSGALHTSGAWSLMLLGASSRSPAGPRRRPPASQSGPPVPPVPSTSAAYAVLRLPSNVARNSLAVIS